METRTLIPVFRYSTHPPQYLPFFVAGLRMRRFSLRFAESEKMRAVDWISHLTSGVRVESATLARPKHISVLHFYLVFSSFFDVGLSQLDQVLLLSSVDRYEDLVAWKTFISFCLFIFHIWQSKFNVDVLLHLSFLFFLKKNKKDLLWNFHFHFLIGVVYNPYYEARLNIETVFFCGCWVCGGNTQIHAQPNKQIETARF